MACCSGSHRGRCSAANEGVGGRLNDCGTKTAYGPGSNPVAAERSRTTSGGQLDPLDERREPILGCGHGYTSTRLLAAFASSGL